MQRIGLSCMQTTLPNSHPLCPGMPWLNSECPLRGSPAMMVAHYMGAQCCPWQCQLVNNVYWHWLSQGGMQGGSVAHFLGIEMPIPWKFAESLADLNQSLCPFHLQRQGTDQTHTHSHTNTYRHTVTHRMDRKPKSHSSPLLTKPPWKQTQWPLLL